MSDYNMLVISHLLTAPKSSSTQLTSLIFPAENITCLLDLVQVIFERKVIGNELWVYVQNQNLHKMFVIDGMNPVVDPRGVMSALPPPKMPCQGWGAKLGARGTPT